MLTYYLCYIIESSERNITLLLNVSRYILCYIYFLFGKVYFIYGIFTLISFLKYFFYSILISSLNKVTCNEIRSIFTFLVRNNLVRNICYFDWFSLYNFPYINFIIIVRLNYYQLKLNHRKNIIG